MKVVFISNYINHHQIPFCEACRRRLGDDFVFIQTQPVEEERLRMGWTDAAGSLSYVVVADMKGGVPDANSQRMILECDVLLAGWAPGAKELVRRRLDDGKVTFCISERIYKDGQWKAVSPRGLVDKYRTYTRYRCAPYYLLCAGAYVASDFSLIRAFPGKKLRWGYFPPCRQYAPGELEEKKKRAPGEPVQIIWAGRFVDFKNPMVVLQLADDLKQAGEQFHLHIAGSGDQDESFRQYIADRGLQDMVTMYGFRTPDEIRALMERSEIHVMTSDHGEGWGAVLNEAMNSGCAVVAGTEAGAVPSLVRDGENGLVYHHLDRQELLECVRRLLHDEALRRRLGKAACETITGLWNADVAARRLLEGCESLLLQGRLPDNLAKEGPFSPDPCLKPFV